MSAAAVSAQTLTQLSYLVAAALFIVGLKRMSSPLTAVSGVRWAGAGMLLATLVTLAFMGASQFNLMLVLAAILAGGALAWISGKRVAMTNMPQMIALYNGMGGGAAAAIAAVELYRGSEHSTTHLAIALIGGFIGSVSFSGSLIAFGKLQGLITKSIRFGGQRLVNLAILVATVAAGVATVAGVQSGAPMVSAFFVLALVLGIAMTLPIGGADMPVVISLYNALTGLAVGFEGFVLDNAAMIIAGTVVGAAGTLLTQLMAKAMNRSLGNVLFSNFGESGGAAERGHGHAEGDRGPGCGRHARVLAESDRRTGLRHGRRAGPAQGLGIVPVADRTRRHGAIRDTSGGRPHARPHERPARGGRRSL